MRAGFSAGKVPVVGRLWANEAANYSGSSCNGPGDATRFVWRIADSLRGLFIAVCVSGTAGEGGCLS
jgi:hypothetical protein